jgi:hypothetical protein
MINSFVAIGVVGRRCACLGRGDDGGGDGQNHSLSPWRTLERIVFTSGRGGYISESADDVGESEYSKARPIEGSRWVPGHIMPVPL